MTTTTFFILLSALSVLSGYITKWIKNIITDRENLKYNILALVVAFIVGGCGTAFYNLMNGISFDTNSIIFIIIMGLACGLVSMLGFDDVKDLFTKLFTK